NRNVIVTRQAGQWLFQQGSELKFVRSSNLAEYARLTATQVTYDQSSGRFTITVDQDLPASLAVGDLVTNATQSNSRFLIRRNFFHDHNSRGMLIQAPKGVVEDNVIRNPTLQCAELFADGQYFLEGPG